MRPHPEAYATVAQLREGTKAGSLVSASAVAHVRDGTTLRWVLLQRDEKASIGAGLWQFPAGRCSPDELPSETAARELAEEVEVREASGTVLCFKPLKVSEPAWKLELLTSNGTLRHDRCQWVLCENTLEGICRFEAQASLDGLQARDLEPYGRRVELLSAGEILTLLERGQLTTAAAYVTRLASDLGWFEVMAR